MADALSRMPQHDSQKEEVVDSVIPPFQISMAVTTRSQKTKMIPKVEGDLQSELLQAVHQDEWLRKNRTFLRSKGYGGTGRGCTSLRNCEGRFLSSAMMLN